MSVRDISAGTVVDGRYTIKHRIGSGGMADVYCALDEQLGREVALKLLHRRFAEDHEFVERFRREASSAAGLQHPNVVGVFDRGEWDGTSYIAMEHLEGRTLKQLIVEEAPLEPIRAIDLAVQVLRAARFAHKRGVIHRDLKPHNVIVDPEGRAKVTDFGIARAGASDMTQTGSIMGTAQYLSPEQAQGLPVDERSDLYSVGVVLYEMLTGRVPFTGDSAVSIALKQVAEAPAPPRTLNPDVPPELEAVVLRALEKQAERRFQDADEFITALDRVRGHLAAGGAPTGEPTTAFAAIGTAPTALAAPAAAEAYALGASTGAYPATPPPAHAVRERERRSWPWVLLALLVLAGAGALAFALTRPAKVVVPNVVNQPVQGARARLINAGFEVRIDRQRDPTAPIDTVIRQDPQPNTRAEKGAAITLTVSEGPGTAGVPNVLGDGRLQATRKLKRAGFDVRVRREPSDDVPENHVIDTNPSPGTLAQVGSEVSLTVSTGRKRVEVPKVTGLDREEASSQLSDTGLRVSVDERDSDQDPGTVLQQSPPPGTRVVEGTTVTIVIAREPEQVEVPDVNDQDEGTAVNVISDAHLSPRTRDKDVTDPDQDGKVIRQNPSAGRKVKRGSMVILTIGRFSQPPDTGPGQGDEGQTTPTIPSDTGGTGPPG
ncbi:MAG TPA: Stk1 family PASTA domain-containing Ser/Thr kinase [Solirubrobacteraceae bacterium]|jgi:serine/threonine-protein kinase